MTEQSLQVGDLSFAARRFGSEADPTIIMIRGLGTQLIEWSDVLLDALVAGGLQVVIFDNRDVGCSSKLEQPYALTDMAADVVGILDALAIERAHVFGISLGGMVAQLVAVDHPARVRCLFSVMSSSGAPGLPQAAPEIRERMLAEASGRDEVISLDASNRVLFGSPGYPESEAVRMAMATRVYDRCYYPAGVARQLQAALADGSRVDRLKQITAPTLVLHGVDDPLLLPECGADTARHIPNAELALIEGMGHNIPDALAPEIAARVLEFIARH